ncbi:MAG: 3-deoxy-7-phosphoheptulonate synthase [Planctomycetota bacterium]|jgi:3-deoxy-7-phosphoheptulonate synthase
MLLFCRHDQPSSDRDRILKAAREAGFLVQPVGPDLLALFGAGDASSLEGLPGVERIEETPESPVLAGRGDRAGTAVVDVAGVAIGEGFTVVAGPCAVESERQLLSLAAAAKAAGANILRGGAYKPRTSPYDFRGLGVAGLELLEAARAATGLPVVTEALDTRDVALVAERADMIQVGSRNMMNYSLLAEAARAERPVLLKRGMGATVDEFLSAAEYLLVGGAPGVVLCERGVRGFGDHLRFTLDLAVVPILKERTHLPVMVDPSHATGRREVVPAMARAAAAAGADGVMVEIHEDPEAALSDGRQAMVPGRLPELVAELREIAAIAGRSASEKRR